MAIIVRQEGDVSIVELSGEFTLGRAKIAEPLDLHGHRLEDIGDTLSGLLERNNVKIVLDLRHVNFMDSAGLGDLVLWKKRTAQMGGDLRLSRPQQRVGQLFELTFLTRVFQIFESEAEAVASFR